MSKSLPQFPHYVDRYYYKMSLDAFSKDWGASKKKMYVSFAMKYGILFDPDLSEAEKKAFNMANWIAASRGYYIPSDSKWILHHPTKNLSDDPRYKFPDTNASPENNPYMIH